MAGPTVYDDLVEQLTSGNSLGVTYPLVQVAGHCNIVFVYSTNTFSSEPVASVVSSNGNTYVPLIAYFFDGNDVNIGAWICENVNAGTETVTVTWTNSQNAAEVYVVSTTAIGGVDFAIYNMGNNDVTTAFCGPQPTTYAQELALGYCGNGYGTTSAGTGWTPVINSGTDSNGNSGNFNPTLAEYQAVAAAGTAVTATTNMGGLTDWVQFLIGLYPPTSGQLNVPLDPVFFGMNF
jgi:hypothetical protein